jgi:hypothetical protein
MCKLPPGEQVQQHLRALAFAERADQLGVSDIALADDARCGLAEAVRQEDTQFERWAARIEDADGLA